MAVRRRLRNMKMSSARRLSERRSQSVCLAVIFLGFFACIIVTEVFLVDKDDNVGDNSGLASKLGYPIEGLAEKQNEVEMPPRIARDLVGVSKIEIESVNKEEPEESSPKIEYRDDEWQPVKDTRDKFFVFSAYYDDRKTRMVRVVAAARTRIADRVSCIFWFGNKESTTVLATNKLIRENWNLKYSAYFVLCPIRRDISRIPVEVSIVKQGSSDPTNRLLVHNNKSRFNGPKGLAVCVKPLHYNYDKILNFVEFIELNRIMGVNHFIFYNHTVGPNVSCALDFYRKRGLATVLPWTLDMKSQKEIRTEGLFAALNDCLYRTMYRFRFVLMIDLDEYVVPHSNKTLTAMLNSLYFRNPTKIGSFSFQNSFFYLQWPNDTRSYQLTRPLLTLQKTKRKFKFHAHKQRSKCIVIPERVVEMGNHFVWEFMSGKATQNVHPDTAFLHHYRVCEFGGSDCINTTSVVDRRIYVWKDDLVKATDSSLETIESSCHLQVTNGTLDKT